MLFLGAWIVSCGMESGVVHFIEDAVDEYITMEDLHIPIVGVLSQEVFNEVIIIKKIAILLYKNTFNCL